jgi:hypothetical protein
MYQKICLIILFIPILAHSFEYPVVKRDESINESHFGIDVRN